MRISSLMLMLALQGCTVFHTPGAIERELERAQAAAERYASEENELAAAQLVESILAIDGDHPRARALKESLSTQEIENAFPRGYLGSNRAHRVLAPSSVPMRALLYLPDRVFDLLDIISFDVHLGWGLFLNAHITRAVQVGAGGRAAVGLGWHDHRSLGVQTLSEGEVVIPGVGLHGIAGKLFGTSGIYSVGDGLAGVQGPMAELYQTYRDYWAVGVEATALVVGLNFDVHPVEIADFLVGFTTIDFLRDDFAATDTIWMDNADRNLLWKLTEIRRSQPSMDAYQDHLRKRRTGGAPAGESPIGR